MTKRSIVLLLALSLIALRQSFSQCTDGTQPECQCSTAPVLCTVDELDNYMFSMSSFQHPQDAPQPLCPGANNTVPNNPTWFAFTAWCTDLTLEAIFSNCTQNQGSIGVQIAIYEDCTFTNAVACNVAANDCNTNNKTLTMTGLTIGGVYYFLVDGCLGSYCDVTIDIVGVCGQEEIAPWTQGVTGETNACGGNTETYSVETLDGAATYHWFVDGVLMGTSSDPTFDIAWATAGSYQLCIDASNDPCVPIIDPPAELCTTINVYESEAGTITAPSPLCPNEIANISVSGFNMGVDNAQAILITDASGVILEVINGSTGTYTSATCGTFTIYSYNYIPAIGTAPVVGLNVNDIDCTVECCDLENITISFEDNQPPVFTNPPADVTLVCSDLVPIIPDLDWTDNCDGMGTVQGVESGSADVCNGGTITRTWEHTDDCGNTATHVQTITVTPAPPPTFTNPPAGQTVTCDNIPTSAPDLSYTNGAIGACEISGMVSPTQSGNADICGGTISYTWDFTDNCGNNISHTQNITVTPAMPPMFINPPADLTVTCDNIPTSAPDLEYTNNENGSCLVTGMVSPTQSGNADLCGGTISFTWDFTDICGNNISHTQNITVTPATPPTFINPPADLTVTCDNIPTGAPDLEYTNNENGSCLIMGTVSPTQSGSADICGGTISYTWEFTDICGNNISHTQNITVTPATPPTFINPPADLTVTCDNIPTGAPDLEYTNNENGSCLIMGTISPTQSGSADICGGTISYTWEFTDICGNNISHTQNITVTPPMPPAFINPPADLTVSCDNIPTGAPDLEYTNNENGSCLIMGTVSPTQSGSADLCGGTISFTWDFTDICGNNISHTQNITVTPPMPPAFINPPGDLTVTCDNIPMGAPDLEYTNNENGSCLIMGTVSPTQSGSADICGGTISYTWEFTDICGNNISHTQNITVTPPMMPAFNNPPADLTVTCDNIPTGAPDLEYTNNENGSCLVMGTVSPTQSGSADICGGTISYTWEFTDICGNNISHTQNITVTPPMPPAFINPPTDQTVSCGNIPTGAPDLEYTNNENGSCLVMGTVSPTQSGSAAECGGTISYTWTFTDICNNTITHTQNYTVEPAPPASFIGNLPLDLTVSCDNVPGIPPPLQYTNNENGICEISGFAGASQSGSYDECGGLIIFLWQFTDDCGRTISHSQNVTVTPAPVATFIDPPGPITIDCSSIPNILPTLNYTNNQTGLCAINGSVSAIQSGFYDACGGNIIYTWTFTDDCNRSISHSQNVVVTPASDPMFTTLPPDITINCGEQFPVPVDLTYTNNETGNCAITGAVPATVTSTSNGGMEYTWTYTNPCNNLTITHTQVIDQTPSPDIVIDPTQVTICEGEFFDLSLINVTDLNNTSPNITFHSGTPATLSNQLPSSNVNPLITTTYYILASNSFGCSDEASIEILLEEPPFAGFDGMGEICFDSPNNINLFSYLTGAYSPNGTWLDVNGYGVNLSNPNNVSLQGLPPGSYTFEYAVASGGVCPDDVASVTLEFLPEVFIAAFDILCSADPNFYEVSINTFGADIIVLAGTYTDLGNDLGIVTDIPIDQSLVIIATDPSSLLCTFTLNISPPDCDCPNIPPPLNDGDAVICEGEINPLLSVSVGAGETANWYDAPSGGNLLQGGSTSFTPSETAVGIYTFYVETENILSGCVSSILTPVQFEISENPIGNNATLEECDEDGDGFVEFNLTEANSNISSNLSYSFDYYETLLDAQNGANPLPNLYTNTNTPSQVIFAVISNSANCSAIVEVTLTVNPTPTISLQVVNETCLGDEDGSVTIVSPTGSNYSLDNINWTTNNTFGNLTAGNYTAYVEDDNGCIGSQNFEINQGLELVMDNFELVCDNNETASDATDDFYNITFTVSNNNGNTGTFSVFDDNTNTPALNYNQSNTISIPAQGQSLTLIFSDDNTSCSIEQPIGPLNSCSTDCSIAIDQLEFTCSDNGTSNDLTDDFYTVTINASAINGAANNSYNVLIDGIINFNYTYNNVNTFNIPADGGSPVITVVDNQDPQCQASQSIGPLDNCSDPCVINFDLLQITCNDNGTITDPTDDFYDINVQAVAVNPGAANSFEIFIDNISFGIFDYANGAMFTLPADGNNPLILIQDTDEPLCTAQQNIGLLEPCNEDCSINATVSNITCDDNETGNDDSDDTFSFDLLVNGQNIGAAWQATDGSISGNYATTQNFGPFLIANGDLNFDIQDMTTLNCLTSIIVNAPATCSDPCVINFDLLQITCNDNGTITDPTDDFYDINVQAMAVNPGAANSFEIFINNISFGIFDYANGAMFTLPADGNNPLILIQDTDEPLCTAQQNIGLLEPCNEDCSINATVSNITCDDNGTGNDDSDDTFSFDLLVNGQNIGAAWQATDGSISGNYATTQNFGPFLIANGDLNFDIQDMTTLNCLTSIIVNAPATCSDPCVINFDLLQITCNNNGTITDPTDDFYDINVQAVAVNPGAANSFEIFINNISFGTFDYATGAMFTLPADGSNPLIVIQDSDEPLCTAQQNIGLLEPCNEDCAINATVSNIICDDNGTGNDDSDDTFSFDLLVNGQNIGAAWQATDGSISGNYATTQNFGPFLLVNGDLNFDIQDMTTLNCLTSIIVNAPATCSDPCVINFDLLQITCNNNGTITDPTDDFYDINVQAVAVNPGAANSFEIFINNISFGTFDYATGAMFTLPADGSNPLIVIQDSDEPLCTAQQNIGLLEPCNEDCAINATVSNITCDDNGTGNDDSDDTFSFDLLVNGQNIGTTWQATDGSISGNYATTQNFGPFLLANGDLNFDIQDMTTLNCLTSIIVNAPATCSDPCVINFDLLQITCNDNGTITDPTDDFYDINVQAVAVNPGAANSFEIFINNISFGTFDYATGAMFTLPADGSNPLIVIQDSAEPLCSAQQNIGLLEPCNEDCAINATVSNITCDDNGTGNDDSDDTFSFDLLVNGQNIGTTWQATDGSISGNYATTQNFGPFLIANGDLNFDIQDMTTLNCLTSIIVNAPATCSSCPQTIDAGLGSTLNCNNTIANLIGSSSEPGNYLWTGPNTFSSTNLTTSTSIPGWYYLTATFVNNCTATDSVFIDIENDTPFANAGPDQSITCEVMEVTLDGSTSTGQNLSYVWTTANGIMISNQAQITTNVPGIYTLQVTNLSNGCTASDQVQVFLNTDLPSAVIYADPENILDCVISSITLTSDNEANVIYSWNGIITSEYVVTEGGNVNLIAIDTITGCQNSNQITISDIQDYPFVNLDPPAPISCYEPNSIIDGSNSQQGINIVYNWYDANNNLIIGENGNTLSVDVGGIYYLQLIDTLNGCENTDSVFVESLLNVPLAQPVEDISLFCGDTVATLNVNVLGALDDVNITWSTPNGNILSGANTQNPVVNQTGNYTVTIQDILSGCITTDNLMVNINNNIPQLMTANVYDETCFNANDGLIVIASVAGGEPPFTYTLNGNPTDNSGQFQNLAPGFYNIVLTDANGCTLEDNFTINPGVELELNLPEVIEILEGNAGTIQAIVNVPVDSLSYIQWSPPGILSCDTCLTTTIETIDDQTFQLTIVDNNGCVAIAVINIIIVPQVRIYIPNVFSPNFDGDNDYFTLFANDQVEEILELSIFDRWGEHVFKKENFEPNNPNIGWDGRLKGKEMNPAVFVYIFEVKLKDGSTRVYSGDVTLTK